VCDLWCGLEKSWVSLCVQTGGGAWGGGYKCGGSVCAACDGRSNGVRWCGGVGEAEEIELKMAAGGAGQVKYIRGHCSLVAGGEKE